MSTLSFFPPPPPPPTAFVLHSITYYTVLFSSHIYSKIKKASKKRGASKKGQKNQKEASDTEEMHVNPENVTVIIQSLQSQPFSSTGSIARQIHTLYFNPLTAGLRDSIKQYDMIYKLYFIIKSHSLQK